MRLLFLWLAAFGIAQAQEMGALFRPGPSGRTFTFKESFYGRSKVHGQAGKLEQRDWDVRGSGSIWQKDGWEMTLGLEARDLVLHHPSPLLHPYRMVQGTLGARRYGKANQVRGFNISYGSASDRPFRRVSNDTASANYVHQFNEKWWMLVNWSNNRTFLNNVPLPGVFYVAKMSRQETLLYGLPVFMWRKRWASGIEGQYFGFIPFNHRAHVGWFWNDFHGVVLSYEYRPQVYFRDARQERDERFFFIENRLLLEIQGSIIPRLLQWQIGAGHAFNRSAFEARNFSSKKRFDLPLGDTWLAQGQVSSQF